MSAVVVIIFNPFFLHFRLLSLPLKFLNSFLETFPNFRNLSVVLYYKTGVGGFSYSYSISRVRNNKLLERQTTFKLGC